MLVTLLVRGQRRRQRIVAVGLSEHYRQIFELTRLDEAIQIFDTEGNFVESWTGTGDGEFTFMRPNGDPFNAIAFAADGTLQIERAGDAFHVRVDQAIDRFLDQSWQRAHPECGPIVEVDGAGLKDAIRRGCAPNCRQSAR